MKNSAGEAFLRLVTIMDELREKCPWDKKQTIHTLRQLTIEETYELADSITETNWKGIKEELGDLLLHIVLQCTDHIPVAIRAGKNHYTEFHGSCFCE